MSCADRQLIWGSYIISARGLYALDGLDMTVPVGAIFAAAIGSVSRVVLLKTDLV
ncbi:MAG: hypothetical protein IJ555_04705 [Ruminococcus sp.]|nr:hypothetical protein [Ruminococcus sp.]